MKDRFVLASASPRRRELLSLLNLDFETKTPSQDDIPLPRKGESPGSLSERLALVKARACASEAKKGTFLGADTIVVLGKKILGKPKDAADAREMLLTLLGKKHSVITGLALIDVSTGSSTTCHVATSVTMRRYTQGEIEEYIASGDPMDKAGAYGVQNKSFRPAAHVDGCYLNVVGLPLCSLVEMLQGLGIKAKLKSSSLLPMECHNCPLRTTGEASWQESQNPETISPSL